MMIERGGIDPAMMGMAQRVRGGAQEAMRGERFDSVLRDEVMRGRAGERAASPEEKARRAAESLVTLALVQPVLKQLRESNMAEAPFAPGEAEKQFGPLLDAEISKRITQASNFPLVDRVAQYLLEHEERRGAGANGVLA